MLIFLAMLLLGGIVGFVGAGGAGVTIALLTAFFGVPVHTALGTSLAGMMFTTLSGSVSHFREGNILSSSLTWRSLFHTAKKPGRSHI